MSRTHRRVRLMRGGTGALLHHRKEVGQMLTQYVNRRLASVRLSPRYRALLDRAIADADQDPRTHALHSLPLDIFQALGGEDDTIVMPFVAAWTLLDYTVLRLDHLQDGDPEDHPLPTAPDEHASYNLVFSLFIAASSLLDELDPRVPMSRWLRLRHLWNRSLLAAASGQQQDLASGKSTSRALDRLDEYQELAHAKTGNLFALVFAAPAVLVTDDEALISVCHFAGDMYGALLQLGDDLLDQNAQQDHPGLTLPSAYSEAMQHLSRAPGSQDVLLWDYWRHIRDEYRARVDAAMQQAGRSRLQECVQGLFDTAFGSSR